MSRSSRRSNISSRLAVGFAFFAVVAALGASALLASPTSCATLREGQISESEKFTPAEWQRGFNVGRLNPSGAGTPAIPTDALVPSNTLDGLPLQWAAAGEADTLYRYFLDRPHSADLTISTFLAAGGVEFDRDPARGESFAAYLLASEGERAVAVDLGPYQAALTWADPLENGVRPHDLYWSDGMFNYGLIADRSAVALVNLARGMVCNST